MEGVNLWASGEPGKEMGGVKSQAAAMEHPVGGQRAREPPQGPLGSNHSRGNCLLAAET